MALQCLNSVTGIGERCRQENNFTPIKGYVLASPDFQFDTFTDFVDQTKWLEGIRDEYLFPIQGIKEIEDNSVEDSIYEAPTGEKSLNYRGMRGYIAKVKYDLISHKALYQYPNQKWRIFKFDKTNNIIGTSPDGTVVKGFAVEFMHVSSIADAVGDQPAFTMITIQESNINEINVNGVYFTPTWQAADLFGILPVTATPSTVDTFVFTCTVAYIDNAYLTSAGASTSVAVSGLVAANFKIVDQTGSVLDSATDYTVTESEVTAGTYTIDATVGALVSGSVQVIPSTALLFKSSVATLTAA